MRLLWRGFAGFLLAELYSMFASLQIPMMAVIQRIVAPESLLPGASPAYSDKTVIAMSVVQAGFLQQPYFWIYATKIFLTTAYGFVAVFLILAVEGAFDRRAARST